MTTLNPAVTATVHGERPKLAALRVNLGEDIVHLRSEMNELIDCLADNHREFASHYTQDLEFAQRHVESAWRSLGYAREIIEGK